MRRTILVSLVATVLPAVGVHAQRDRRASIAVQALGGPRVGLWLRAGDRLDLGIETGIQLRRLDDEDGANEERFRTVTLALVLKRFMRSEDVVRPYLVAGPFLAHMRVRSTVLDATSQATSLSLGAEGGVGLEWFPTRRVSVGAHVTVRAAYVRDSQERPDPFGGSPSEIVRTGFSGETATSGIRVHLYFR